MDQETLHEVTTYYININKNEEGTSSWHNTTLGVKSEKGLHFYELARSIDCLDKKINCLQTFLPPAKSKYSSKLFTDRVINNSMRNIDYVEMIQDQALWPHNAQLVEEMTSIIYFEWSPLGILPSQDAVLAVLNNIGGVDLFTNENSKWKHKLEISASFAQTFRKSLEDPRDFAELKEAAHILASTAMCWSPTLAGNKYCYIATAQKNDHIMLWKISCCNKNITAQFQGSIESCEGEILTIKWIPLSENNFMLVCSNIFGQIILFECSIENDVIQSKESFTIWPDKDRMISKLLQYVKIDDNIIVICNKHRHLLILLLDKYYNVCGKYINNINDHRITCITKFRDEIYLSTVNCKVYKINILVKDNNLTVNLGSVECNDISSTCELYNISFSQNGVLCTFITVDRKVNFRKESLKINIILATKNNNLDSLVNLLLKNPTEKLTCYWDVIELLRYKCMKHKELPSIVYTKLYEDACQNIYFLKLYYIFVTFYVNLKRLFKINPINNIPEESLEAIKEEMLVIHAEILFRKYNDKRMNKGQLEGIENESFLGAINFLKYFCKKSNRDLTEILDIEQLHQGDTQCEYICQGCDEKIEGFTCKNRHLNTFCSLTFTPIDSFDYLSCPWCKRTARIELAIKNPTCLFCDVNLVST